MTAPALVSATRSAVKGTRVIQVTVTEFAGVQHTYDVLESDYWMIKAVQASAVV